MTRKALRTVLRLALIGLMIVGLVMFARHLDGPAIAEAFSHASWPPVIAALLFTLIGVAAQIVRTQRFLSSTKHVPLGRLARYHLASNAATNLLPARAGDALRAYLFRANEGIPIPTTVGLALGEYAMKIITLVALALPLPWLISVDLPMPSTTTSIVIGVVAIAIIGAAVYAYRRANRADAPAWLRDLVAALRSLRGNFVSILALTTVAWLSEAIATTLVAGALGSPIGLPGAILVLITLNLALIIPSTPGRIGVFELGAGVGLTLLGVPESDAVAIALLCHLVQYIPTTLLGLAGLPLALAARRELSRSEVTDASSAHPSLS